MNAHNNIELNFIINFFHKMGGTNCLKQCRNGDHNPNFPLRTVAGVPGSHLNGVTIGVLKW